MSQFNIKISLAVLSLIMFLFWPKIISYNTRVRVSPGLVYSVVLCVCLSFRFVDHCLVCLLTYDFFLPLSYLRITFTKLIFLLIMISIITTEYCLERKLKWNFMVNFMNISLYYFQNSRTEKFNFSIWIIKYHD